MHEQKWANLTNAPWLEKASSPRICHQNLAVCPCCDNTPNQGPCQSQYRADTAGALKNMHTIESRVKWLVETLPLMFEWLWSVVYGILILASVSTVDLSICWPHTMQNIITNHVACPLRVSIKTCDHQFWSHHWGHQHPTSCSANLLFFLSLVKRFWISAMAAAHSSTCWSVLAVAGKGSWPRLKSAKSKGDLVKYWSHIDVKLRHVMTLTCSGYNCDTDQIRLSMMKWK